MLGTHSIMTGCGMRHGAWGMRGQHKRAAFSSHASCRMPLLRQYLYLRNVPILLREIESVSDHEQRIDGEADVFGLEFDFACGRFVEERSGADHRGAAALDVAVHFAHGEAA